MTNLILEKDSASSKKEDMDKKEINKIHIQKVHIQKVVPSKVKVVAEPGCRPIGS